MGLRGSCCGDGMCRRDLPMLMITWLSPVSGGSQREFRSGQFSTLFGRIWRPEAHKENFDMTNFEHGLNGPGARRLTAEILR